MSGCTTVLQLDLCYEKEKNPVFDYLLHVKTNTNKIVISFISHITIFFKVVSVRPRIHV